MLKIIKENWDKNKEKLDEKLKSDISLNSCDYLYLVKLSFATILNEVELDLDHITLIDNGDYQGTQLFLIPFETYQPCEYEYLMTHVSYGSCSGCDTLQAIQDWGDEPLNEQQIVDFSKLCLDILTNTIKPYNGGWRNDEDYDTVED